MDATDCLAKGFAGYLFLQKRAKSVIWDRGLPDVAGFNIIPIVLMWLGQRWEPYS